MLDSQSALIQVNSSYQNKKSELALLDKDEQIVKIQTSTNSQSKSGQRPRKKEGGKVGLTDNCKDGSAFSETLPVLKTILKAIIYKYGAFHPVQN